MAVEKRASRKGAARPMKATDAPAVAALFLRVFRRSDAPASRELEDYLSNLTLGSPSYDEAVGSRVYEQSEGRIRSALLAVPMRFVACGAIVPGRLLGVFMSDAGKEAAGAAELILGLRPRRADFAFCDSASPTSGDHLRAIGARSIPLLNLEWVCSFRPAGSLVEGFAVRFLGRRRMGLSLLARPLDGLLRRLRPERRRVEDPGALTVADMPVADFVAHAPRLIAHYAVRPLWAEAELSWLVSLAARNSRLGAFTIRSTVDRTGEVVGCIVYYAAPGRTAHVLNVLSLPGREPAVLGAMFRHLDATGHVDARGRAQPALMAGLASQRWLYFRHRAFALALSRVPEINDAVARGDVYVGGLAGEDWSRLLTDFR